MSAVELTVSGFTFRPVRVLMSRSTVICEAPCLVFGRFSGYLTLATRVDLTTGEHVYSCSLHADLQSTAGPGGDADLEIEGGERPTAELAVGTVLGTLTSIRWGIAADPHKRLVDCPVLEGVKP